MLETSSCRLRDNQGCLAGDSGARSRRNRCCCIMRDRRRESDTDNSYRFGATTRRFVRRRKAQGAGRSTAQPKQSSRYSRHSNKRLHRSFLQPIHSYRLIAARLYRTIEFARSHFEFGQSAHSQGRSMSMCGGCSRTLGAASVFVPKISNVFGTAPVHSRLLAAPPCPHHDHQQLGNKATRLTSRHCRPANASI